MTDKDPYSELGVDRNATQEEIKKAYRKRASETHPDTQGVGSTEKFQMVKFAYDILKDPERRKKYDTNGSTKHTVDQNAVLYNELAILFLTIVDGVKDIDGVDIVSLIKVNLDNRRMKHTAAIEAHNVLIARREKAIKRVSKKSEGKNLLVKILMNDITERRREIVALEEVIAHILELAAVVEDYAYKIEEPTFMTPFGPTAFYFSRA